MQNKLQTLVLETQDILEDPTNVTIVRRTNLRHAVMPEMEDEVQVDVPKSEFAEHITELTRFLMWLLEQQSNLAAGIRKAKNQLPIDMDNEISLNKQRQCMAGVLRRMAALRSREIIMPNGGTGYRFNADGNQVSFRCDVKKVMSINFDRNVVQKQLDRLNRKSDEVSAELDRCLINSTVEYQPLFDVNSTFADVFRQFLGEVEG